MPDWNCDVIEAMAHTGELTLKNNKPGTAQVGAISKAQKQQKDFKVSGILFNNTRKKHGPNCAPFRMLNIRSVAKHKKIEGDPLQTLKTFQKSLTKPKQGTKVYPRDLVFV